MRPYAIVPELMVILSCAKTASQEVRRNMASFKEVRNNMSEGLRFYMSLQEAIAVLAQQAGDYILTRRLQRWDSVLICLLWDMGPMHCRQSLSIAWLDILGVGALYV